MTCRMHDAPVRVIVASVGSLIVLLSVESVAAVSIHIDYSYDSNSFFDPGTPDGSAARAAMQAVANRYDCLLDATLSAVPSRNPAYPFDGSWRIGFSHPGTGADFQISTSDSAATDPLVVHSGADAADVYDNSFSLASDQWILYVGGRSLTSAGEGGTASGLNYFSVLSDPAGPQRRDVAGITELPLWGGAVTFDNDGSTSWHFDHTSIPGTGTVDFYSIALHEVGHVLGLNTVWSDFDQWVDSNTGGYSGPDANGAYQADNATGGGLSVHDGPSGNNHWADGAFRSFPHAGCGPAVGASLGALQDLLMEPILNLTTSTPRFELTNVDVAALQDVGWSTVPEPNSGGLALTALLTICLRARKSRRTKRNKLK